MQNQPSILIIDDEENLRRTLALILEREGFSIETASNVKEARQLLKSSHYDLIFLDLKLPDVNGLTFLPELRNQFPATPVLILTAHDKLESAIEAVRKGARDYLLKPIDPPLIIQRVKEVLAEREQPQSARERYTQLKSMLKELRSEENPITPAPEKDGG